jgi:tryptophanase
VKAGDIVPGNAHFDTTKAHIEARGARAIDCTIPESAGPRSSHPFKGNVDIMQLDATLAAQTGRVPYVLVTLTCNTRGGQPVSMENLEQVSKVVRSHGVPLFFDIARYAENAWFIKTREPGYAERSIAEITQTMMGLADGVLMSAKKNALVNIGGFLALRDKTLYELCVPYAVLHEGFVTYGGLAGRDLAAMAVGLREGLEERHLAHRIAQVQHLAERLQAAGVPVITPPGGHAVSIDADAFFPHLGRAELPAQTLVCEIYLEGGVRTVEVGSVLAGRDADSHENTRSPLELVRLAVPARAYSYAHLDYVADVVARVFKRRDGVRGLAFAKETPVLRHFTSAFRRLA